MSDLGNEGIPLGAVTNLAELENAPKSSPFDPIWNAPKFIITYFVSLLVALISDTDIATLGLFGASAGLAADSVFAGLAAFFGLYALLRAIGHSLGGLANAVFNGFSISNRER